MTGPIMTREQFDAEREVLLAAARKEACATGGHLPVKPVSVRLRDAVPFSISCDCGGYSWLPVRRGAVEVTTP